MQQEKQSLLDRIRMFDHPEEQSEQMNPEQLEELLSSTENVKEDAMIESKESCSTPPAASTFSTSSSDSENVSRVKQEQVETLEKECNESEYEAPAQSNSPEPQPSLDQLIDSKLLLAQQVAELEKELAILQSKGQISETEKEEVLHSQVEE